MRCRSPIVLLLAAFALIFPGCGQSAVATGSGAGATPGGSGSSTSGSAGGGAGGTASAGGTTTVGGSAGGGGTAGTGTSAPTGTCSTGSCPADCEPAACVCPFQGPLAGYAEHDGLRAIDAGSFVLADTGTWETAAAHFDGLGLPVVSLDALDLNRTGTAPAGTLKSALQSMVSYSGGFAWEPGDQTVTYWVPQGISPGVTAGGKAMVAVSWHYDEAHVADDPNPPMVGKDKGI